MKQIKYCSLNHRIKPNCSGCEYKPENCDYLLIATTTKELMDLRKVYRKKF